MKAASIFLLAVTLALANAGRSADIVGVITLKGTPPPEKEITPLMDDANCGPLHDKPPTTQFYVVSPKGELADVVVSLQGVDGKSTGASVKPAELDQKGCLYTPTIIAIQTGQKLIVKNSDPCIHNVHIVSTVDGNPKSNDAQMPGGADLTYTFPKAEMFTKFQCDVHPWMFAWVSVFDHPYFSVSDKDGTFTIKNVPPGKYTIVAAHRKLGTLTQQVEVKDANSTVNFNFEVK